MKYLFLLFTLSTAFSQEPKVVATPPADAGRGLIRVSAKEIRHYSGDKKQKIFLQSMDNGLTWTEKKAPNSYPDNFGGIPNESPAITYLPLQKEFIRVQPIGGFIFKTKDLDGQWAAVTKDGKLETDWKDPEKQKNFQKLDGIMRNPTLVQNGKRILIPAHDKSKGTWFHISDDGGLTWKRSQGFVHVDKYTPSAHDGGPRWHNGGVEATVVELKNGKIWCLVRTAHNQHWQSFSSDGGETWEATSPSRFYGTLTMISLTRLNDGKLAATWTNTTALAERAHGRNDDWEDVFTNRDSHHIALSDDDGKTWYGFREIFLGELRNEANYGDVEGSDRGSHQSEVLDLGKENILIALGQHPLHRKLVIVNTKWAGEKLRSSNFSKGMDDWTTHTYIPILRGHCAYNRKSSAQLVSAPTFPGKKALEIKFSDDPSLVTTDKGAADYRTGGATWNFPNSAEGVLNTKIYFNEGSEGIHLSLCDRLFNACDTLAPEQSMFSIKLAPKMKIGSLTLKEKTWYNLLLTWKGKSCELKINGVPQIKLDQQQASPNGISYLHFISAATAPDTGTLILSSAEKSTSPDK